MNTSHPNAMEDKIINKIRKILRLAFDKAASAGEIAAAMQKAREIATEHGVDLDSISLDDQQSTTTHRAAPISATGQAEKLAAQVIMRQFPVAVCFESKNGKLIAQVVGPGTIADIAAYAYEYLVKAMRSAWTKRENRRLKRRDDFLHGFAHAILWEMRDQFRINTIVPDYSAYITDVVFKGAQTKHVAVKNSKRSSDAALAAGARAARSMGVRNALPTTRIQ